MTERAKALYRVANRKIWTFYVELCIVPYVKFSKEGSNVLHYTSDKDYAFVVVQFQ